ncbi:MAG: hypothetical protein H7256_10075 [Bdellovibrio sp.]|nr:hypothetical protein [Bdellovibrio sp.]
MLKSILATLLLTVGLTARAQDGQFAKTNESNTTPAVCADAALSVCATLHFVSVINTSTEGEFIVHVTTPNETPISGLKVSLWMNMGGHSHGSAPVEIAAMNETNQFKISNAWFVMSGPWLVQVEFIADAQAFKLTIPVTVAE